MNTIVKVSLSQIIIKTDKIQYYNPNYKDELLACTTVIDSTFESKRKQLMNKYKKDPIVVLDIDHNNQLLNKEDLISVLKTVGNIKALEHSLQTSYPRNGKYLLTEWSYIFFMEKKFTFQVPGKLKFTVNHLKSKSIFEHIKPFFAFHSFQYMVTFENDNPVGVEITDDIFDCLDLGAMLHRIKDKTYWSNKKILVQISEMMDSLSKRRIVHKFKGFLNIDKSYYFTCLSELQEISIPIKVLLEPQFWKTTLSGYDISFLYTATSKNRHYAIWESIETKKATFVFSFKSMDAYKKGIDSFSNCLRNPRCYYGREMLRIQGIDALPIQNIHRVFHNPQVKVDTDWKSNLIKCFG